MEFERPKQMRMHLDIAPLIDIVFLLLIFFMLTANFIMQPGIKITLPSATSAQEQPAQKIMVFISEDGTVCLNDETIYLDNLKDALQIEIDKSDEKIVILKADKKIDLGLAVKIMDISKESGARDVVIATEIDKVNSLKKDCPDEMQ
jgi:biopolymer transport protein ExbD